MAHEPEAPGTPPAAAHSAEARNWRAILLVALAVYAVLLVIVNSKQVSIDFVFFSAKTNFLVLILLSMGLGALIMWLLPRLLKRRHEHQAG
jgi:uncharacterized integral membrane protein